MRRHVVTILLVVLVLGLAIGAGVLWNRPPGDLVGEWLATSVEIDGEESLEPTDSSLPILTITGEGDLRASINAGCNTMGGSMTYRWGGRLDIGELSSTLMGCPARLEELDAALLDALGRVDHVAVDDEELLLTGDGVEMAFTRLTA